MADDPLADDPMLVDDPITVPPLDPVDATRLLLLYADDLRNHRQPQLSADELAQLLEQTAKTITRMQLKIDAFEA
jgi:hypothetical protein